jgi:hypothetical protein
MAPRSTKMVRCENSATGGTHFAGCGQCTRYARSLRVRVRIANRPQDLVDRVATSALDLSSTLRPDCTDRVPRFACMETVSGTMLEHGVVLRDAKWLEL